MIDNLEFERGLLKEYINNIAGCDEAGRGPLAGPLVVASVIMPLDEQNIIIGVDDSKKLSEKKREMLYDKIIEKALAVNVVIVDENTIDDLNILGATRYGMQKCINELKITPNFALIDAVDKLNLVCKSKSIIHGDALCYSIAAASIIAKVTRDRLMKELAKQYPQYCFEKHKGYGTALHIELLKKYGKCEIHRNSFIKHFVE